MSKSSNSVKKIIPANTGTSVTGAETVSGLSGAAEVLLDQMCPEWESKFYANLSRLADQCESQKRKIEADRKSIEDLTVRLHEATLYIERSDLNFQRETANQREESNRRLAKMSDQMWSQDLEFKAVEEERTTLSIEVARLREESGLNQQRLYELERAFAAEQARAAAFETDLRGVRAEADRRLNELTFIYTSKNEQAFEKQSRLRDENDRTLRECENARQELRAATSEVTALRESVTRQQYEMQHIRFEADGQLALQRAELENVRVAYATEQALHAKDDLELTALRDLSARQAAQLQEFTARHSLLVTDSGERSRRLEEQLSEKSEAARLAETQLHDLRTQVKDLTENGRQHEFELREQTTRLQSELTVALRDLDVTRAAHMAMATECGNKEAHLKCANDENRQLRERVTEKTMQVEKVRADVLRLETALEYSTRHSDERLSAMQMDVEQARERNAELRGQLDAEQTAVENGAALLAQLRMRAEMQERDYQREIEIHREKISAAERQAAAQIAAQGKELGQRHEQITRQNAELAQKSEQVAQKVEIITQLRHQLEIQGTSVEALRSEISQLQLRLQANQASAGDSQYRAQTVLLEAENERLRKWTAQVTHTEQQLRHYAATLNKEKAEMLRVSKELVGEIQMVSKTHPLKDYLNATEYELSKLEVQLKTTPMLAAERPRLETCVAQLVDQREFLKLILANSTKQFEQQVTQLERLNQGGKLAPVPPPPPKSTSLDLVSKVASATTSVAADATAPAPIEARVRWESSLKDLD